MRKFTIIQRNKAIGSKIWYLRIFDTDTKKITFESLGTEKKREAEDILAIRNSERFKTAEQIRLDKLPTIVDAVNKWLDFVSKGNKGTFRVYSNKVPYLLDFCKERGITRIMDFTATDATNLINGLPENNNTQTILNKKRVYSNIFNWIYSAYGIDKLSPFARVKTPKVHKTEREFWTVEQIEKILDATHEPSRRLLYAFMAFAGLRFFEAEGLTWENISGGKIAITGKGDKPARLPIGHRLNAEIERFIDGKPHPDAGRVFTPFYNSTENLHLKKTCSELGLSGTAHCHKFRHSFASNLLRAGASIVAVSKLMRHEKPDITLRVYSHCLPDDLEETLKLL